MKTNDQNLISWFLATKSDKTCHSNFLSFGFQQIKATEAVCFVILMLAAMLKATCSSLLSSSGGQGDCVLPVSCALRNIIYVAGSRLKVFRVDRSQSPLCPKRSINPAELTRCISISVVYSEAIYSIVTSRKVRVKELKHRQHLDEMQMGNTVWNRKGERQLQQQNRQELNK